ncbi:MAG TPA: zinc dependent phospholipase C family protein [Chitinophagaceae bacterium]|nr:zinc dependent phospholipase C family protein [Chitinophagaceae bacterium]
MSDYIFGRGHRIKKIIIFLFIAFASNTCKAYSVLTHEALIDANWPHVLLPLLKEKFPGATKEELKTAHAYAYGGAVVPDMGYYPFGSKLFTDLLHYTRSGDFVEAILREAQNLNEYAFALGVLCHYNADNYGHRLGVNVCVPIIYPKMKREFGDAVTYDENHLSHLRTEFAIDVLQTARGNYSSETYHDYIGFQVAKPVLERAFFKTYGLDVNELFGDFSRTVGTFRWIVKSFFPTITKAAWLTRSDEIMKTAPHTTARHFIYRMHRRNYRREFKNEKPRFFVQILSALIEILPKVGPLRVLNFKMPDAKAEKFFIESFDSSVTHYRNNVTQLRSGVLMLSNTNFDTGEKTALGKYELADKSYAGWLLKLQHKNFTTLSVSIKQNIQDFYGNDNAHVSQGVKQALEQLNSTITHPQ